MKVFISIPMRGKSTEEIVKTRSQIFKQVKKDFPGSKLELLDQIIEDDCPFKGPDAGIWYLAKSIEIMAEADIVVFAPKTTGNEQYASRNDKVYYWWKKNK